MNAFQFYLRKARLQFAGWEEQRRLLHRFPGLQLGTAVTVVTPSRLMVGEGVVIQSGAVIHCGGLGWSAEAGHVSIGRSSVISHQCILFGAGGIDIGERFDCGPACMIFSSRSLHQGDAYPRSEIRHLLAPVSIGDDVILYAGCVVAPGVTVGNGAAIGAGSVVLDDVAPRTLVAGSPARKIRDLD